MDDDRRAEDAPPPARPPDLPHIVYLDPHTDRPISPYSPEGEIRMMGDFAAGLRRRSMPRPVVIAMIIIILLPVVLSVVAVITSWSA